MKYMKDMKYKLSGKEVVLTTPLSAIAKKNPHQKQQPHMHTSSQIRFPKTTNLTQTNPPSQTQHHSSRYLLVGGDRCPLNNVVPKK